MFTLPTQQQKAHSFGRVIELARAGQVPHALVMWNKHMDAHEGCVCERAFFDQTLCGFCLIGRLQTAGLAERSPQGAAPFLTAAEGISAFLAGKKLVAGR